MQFCVVWDPFCGLTRIPSDIAVILQLLLGISTGIAIVLLSVLVLGVVFLLVEVLSLSCSYSTSLRSFECGYSVSSDLCSVIEFSLVVFVFIFLLFEVETSFLLPVVVRDSLLSGVLYLF